MRRLLAAAVAASALAGLAAGCGFGPGQGGDGEATVRVTRDYGAELIDEGTVSDPSESETVIRLLDREADITTRYGGGFVQSIDGLESGVEEGRNLDWFFFVNGIESPTGAADVPVGAGDRIWWDYRDWTDVMRVPAVVGSWPQPFAHAAAGADPTPVRVECAAARAACEEVVKRLAGEGMTAGLGNFPPSQARAGDEAIRVLVGPWARLRSDAAAGLIADGPPASGVFARFEPADGGGWGLAALDRTGATDGVEDRGAGLVAAVREGEEPPVWLVTGTDERGVEAATAALGDEDLRDRYAVVATEDGTRGVPVTGDGE